MRLCSSNNPTCPSNAAVICFCFAFQSQARYTESKILQTLYGKCVPHTPTHTSFPVSFCVRHILCDSKSIGGRRAQRNDASICMRQPNRERCNCEMCEVSSRFISNFPVRQCFAFISFRVHFRLSSICVCIECFLFSLLLLRTVEITKLSLFWCRSVCLLVGTTLTLNIVSCSMLTSHEFHREWLCDKLFVSQYFSSDDGFTVNAKFMRTLRLCENKVFE